MRTRFSSLLGASLLVGACSNLIGLSDYDTDPSLGPNASGGSKGAGGSRSSGGLPNTPGGGNDPGNPGDPGSGGASDGEVGAGGSDEGPGVIEGSAGAGGEPGAPACPRELLEDGGFEELSLAWNEYSESGEPILTNVRLNPDGVARAGDWVAWLGGAPDDYQELSQEVFIDATFRQLKLTGYLRIGTEEESADVDYLQVSLWDDEAATLVGDTLEYSDLDQTATFLPFTITWDVSAYRGRSLYVLFSAQTDADFNTNFFVDDVSITPTCE